MSDLTVVQGDTAPIVKAILKERQEDGTLAVKDLTSVTEVRFQMRRPDDKRYTVDAVASIADAVAGRVQYGWAAGDLSVPAEYLAQWQLTFNDGKVQTTDPPNTITVRRQ